MSPEMFEKVLSIAQSDGDSERILLAREIIADVVAERLQQASEPADPSPTAGMNLGARVEHVGGRRNAAGYIEFGSMMAVDALIRHIIRDLPPGYSNDIRVHGWVWKDKRHEDCYVPSYTPAQHVAAGELYALVDPADLQESMSLLGRLSGLSMRCLDCGRVIPEGECRDCYAGSLFRRLL